MFFQINIRVISIAIVALFLLIPYINHAQNENQVSSSNDSITISNADSTLIFSSIVNADTLIIVDTTLAGKDSSIDYSYINNFMWDAWAGRDMSVTSELLEGTRSLL